MRRYRTADEENIRIEEVVRHWRHAGLLQPTQEAQILETLKTELRRTNTVLRFVLFVFTLLVIGALVLLTGVTGSIKDEGEAAVLCVLAAAICFVVAELTIGSFRFYRFGCEEALASASIMLVTIAAALTQWDLTSRESPALILLIGLAGSVAVYARFGYVYAGVAALACGAGIPFAAVESPVEQRLLSGAVLVLFFVLSRRFRLKYGDDFPGDDFGVFQVVAWAGLYGVMNLQIINAQIPHASFYWATYAATWFLPIIGLLLSIRDKDRLLINVSGAMLLVTIGTNKSYMELPRQTWDPILLGIVLIGAAVFLKRWLSSGPDASRYGFTAKRILDHDKFIKAAMAAAAAFQPAGPQTTPAAEKPQFGGGRSGGAGATGSF